MYNNHDLSKFKEGELGKGFYGNIDFFVNINFNNLIFA